MNKKFKKPMLVSDLIIIIDRKWGLSLFTLYLTYGYFLAKTFIALPPAVDTQFDPSGSIFVLFSIFFVILFGFLLYFYYELKESLISPSILMLTGLTVSSVITLLIVSHVSRIDSFRPSPFPYDFFYNGIILSAVAVVAVPLIIWIIVFITHRFKGVSGILQEQDKDMVVSIELKPLPKQGKKDRNQVILTFSNSKNKTFIVKNERFYFLFLLCVQRLSGNDEKWVPHKSYIDMQYINQMEKLLGRNIPRQYSWIESETQKSTVKTKINSNIAPLIVRTDEETSKHGLVSYYSLISELSDKKNIILHKMK